MVQRNMTFKIAQQAGVEDGTDVPAFVKIKLGAILLCLMMLGMSEAGAVPVATSSVLCQAPSQLDVSGSPSCSQSSANGLGQGTITLSPFVDLSVHEQNAAGTGGFSVFSNLKYSFEVIGGNVGDIVPLMIETSISTSATASTGASATGQIGITTSQGSVGGTFCASILCGAADFFGTFSISAASGSVGKIGLVANVGGGFGGVMSSATADVDPMIFIDPNFANADRYSIVLSDGIGNDIPATTPLPAALPLFASGLGVMGLLAKRRKRRGAAACAAA